jgi:RNA polymerase sigma-70 factor, ECF subfamily
VNGDRGLPRRLADDLDRHFPEVVRMHQDGVYSGALRMTGCREDAEDLAQETFTRAYSALQTYPRERVDSLELRAWLWTIAANLCRNHLRTQSRRPRTSPLEGRPAPGHNDHEPAVDLEAAVLALPAAQRMPVVMRHVVGMSTAEIATALDRPEGTVKSQISRGLDGLRTALEES